MADDTLELKSAFPHFKETLEKLSKVEEQLRLLQDFNNNAEQIRKARVELLHNFITINEQNKLKESTKRVTFKILSYDPSINTLKSSGVWKSKSLEQLITNLHYWSGEVGLKNKEIEKLKFKKDDFSDKGTTCDKQIPILEAEKDKLEEEMLQLIFQNLYDNKDDCQHLVSQLEDENYELGQKLQLSEEKVDCLKQTNLALMRENQCLKGKKENLLGAIASLDMNIRNSIMSSKGLSEANFWDLVQRDERDAFPITPSIQILLDLEKEEVLSLDKESVGSFQLDKPLAAWHTDEDSLQEHVWRIRDNYHEMQVTHRKLNLVKRYIRKHGTKLINRNTLIDPATGMSQ